MKPKFRMKEFNLIFILILAVMISSCGNTTGTTNEKSNEIVPCEIQKINKHESSRILSPH